MPQLFFSVLSSPKTFSTSLRVASFESQASELQTINIPAQTEFNAKWPFKVIQGHVFWSQWKGDKPLSNNVGLIC